MQNHVTANQTAVFPLHDCVLTLDDCVLAARCDGVIWPSERAASGYV